MSATALPLARGRGGAFASGPWLFSAGLDVAVFLGSALLALGIVLVVRPLGRLYGDTPEWAWVPSILLVDVAHVYATGFRTYWNPAELRRRPALYTLVPAAGFLILELLYRSGWLFFWRVLAYAAVFHFVRQQYGWVALYRRRAGERGRLGRWIDGAAIYAATIYPLLYWHTHLPRRFWWFLPGDFAVALPAGVDRAAKPLYAAILCAYAARALHLWLRRGCLNPGKHIVVATTAVCWYVGIVSLNSDFAFTITNVLIHGIPYLALIYWFERRELARRPSRAGRWIFGGGPAPYLGIVWLLAYAEELLWDRSTWHDRPWLFGPAWRVGAARAWLIPLLALPQLTHYVLDGFLWRRRDTDAWSPTEAGSGRPSPP